MAFIDRMKGQDYIDRTRDYLNYIEEHLENVRKAFIELSEACEGMSWVGDDCAWHSLRAEVMSHDLSKFTKEEFAQYRDSFFPVNDSDKACSCFDVAWENHKRNNHHHHETATNYLDVIHMVIDWTAMGYKFGDDAQSYFEENKERISISEEHEQFMYEVFNKIEAYRKKLT